MYYKSSKILALLSLPLTSLNWLEFGKFDTIVVLGGTTVEIIGLRDVKWLRLELFRPTTSMKQNYLANTTFLRKDVHKSVLK